MTLSVISSSSPTLTLVSQYFGNMYSMVYLNLYIISVMLLDIGGCYMQLLNEINSSIYIGRCRQLDVLPLPPSTEMIAG